MSSAVRAPTARRTALKGDAAEGGRSPEAPRLVVRSKTVRLSPRAAAERCLLLGCGVGAGLSLTL